MKIVIATPLYPPDIADPAPYVKELAARLRGGAEITIVTYGSLPEKLDGVTIKTVSKRSPVWIRLPIYLATLVRSTWGADILYVQTGISVELPAVITSLLLPTKVLVRFDAQDKHEEVLMRPLRGPVRSILMWRAATIVSSPDLTRPEILPLEPYPTSAIESYNNAWAEHVTALLTHL